MRKTTTLKKVGQARKLPVENGCDCKVCNELQKIELQTAARVLADMVARIYPGVIVAVNISGKGAQ